MAKRAFAPRLSKRDRALESNRWDRFYALMGGVEPKLQVPVPEKRAVVKREADGTYESDIQRDIIAMLRKHPKVKIVERHNSGTAREVGADGEVRYVKYNTVFKVGKVRMRKSDIDCTLINGKRLVIEVKRPPWNGPTDQRETEQQNYIYHVRAATGYGMFAVSVAQVSGALERIKV